MFGQDSNAGSSPAAPNHTEGKPRARWRVFGWYSWVLFGIAALYVGWVFYSRWDADRRIEQRALEKKRAEDRYTVEMLGGDRFEILHFYASPSVIERGDSAELCYGVSNAKAIRLEPNVKGVWPALSRCIVVSPRSDTTYTLTIEDGKGELENRKGRFESSLSGQCRRRRLREMKMRRLPWKRFLAVLFAISFCALAGGDPFTGEQKPRAWQSSTSNSRVT